MAKKKNQPDDAFFDDALEFLKKQYGSAFDSRGLLGDGYQACPTGHDDLDDVLTKGAKGIYLGGVIEVFGLEGSGKSSVAMRTVGNAQKVFKNKLCAWIDAESGFSPDLAEVNDIDLETLVMPDLTEIKTKSGKEFPTCGDILNMIFDIVQTGKFSLVVVDSVAGLMPMRVLEEDYDPNKPGMAELARAMSEQLPKIKKACQKTGTSVIFINQIRAKPGDIWNPETTPGGWALRFYSDQRLRIDRINHSEVVITKTNSGVEEEQIIGHYARVSVIKTKKAIPYREKIEIPIYYEHYFPDNAKKCFDLAKRLQVITKYKGSLTWKDGEEIVIKTDGEPEMLTKIRDNKWESRLAHCCVIAESGERNVGLKSPIKVGTSFHELASTYNPISDSKIQEENDEEVKGKKKKIKADPKNLDI